MNELKQILKKIQFIGDMTIEEVAQAINYSRSYLTTEVNKGENEEVKNKLLDYEQKLRREILIKEDEQGQKSAQSDTIADLVRANLKLAEAQLVQADANKIQAEANLKHSIVSETLAASNRKLINREPVPTDPSLAAAVLLGNMCEIILDQADGKRYTRKEVEARLYKGGRDIKKKVLAKDNHG